MNIRRAEITDLPAILEIYAYARNFMAETGNPHQWGDQGYPKQELLEQDIKGGTLYAMEQEGTLCGVFAFPIGPDPTYDHIEGGAWLSDAPYGTIHRIAGNGTAHGLLQSCMEYCLTLAGDIRIDTHEDNKVMQHQIEKCGFTYCGIIYAADGTPRLAYQLGLAEF